MQHAPPRPAWEGLVELSPELQRFLSSRCRDVHEVEDAVQETLVRAARYRSTQCDPDRLRPWLLRIGANVLLSRALRRRRSSSSVTFEPVDHGTIACDPPPEELCDEPETWCGRTPLAASRVRAVLDGALDTLPSIDRAAMRAIYLDGTRRELVARRLGVTTELLKVRLFRAKRRLRRAVARELEAVA